MTEAIALFLSSYIDVVSVISITIEDEGMTVMKTMEVNDEIGLR